MLTRKGLEAIMFQSQSSLGKALTAVFQDAIDYRNNLKFNENDLDIRKKRIEKVFRYVTLTTIPKFTAVVKKETNLDIVKVEVSGTSGITGMFAVNLSMDDEDSATDVINMQVGKVVTPKSYRDSLKEMQDMYTVFDTTTGKLNSTTYGSNNRKISCIMYMDAMTAFLLHDFIPERLAEPLLAEELAAIYIHEIGHVLTMVERSNHFYRVLDRETKHMIPVLENTDPKTAVNDFLELGMPTLHKAAEQKQIDPKLVKVVEQSLRTAKYLLDNESGSKMTMVGELIFYIVKSILLVVGYFKAFTRAQIYILSTLYRITQEFSHMSSVPFTEHIYGGLQGKRSDVVDTKHNMYQLERMADEFVSRHGYGGYVASGLNKIGIIFENAQLLGGAVWSTRLRKSKLFCHYVQFITILLSVVKILKIEHPSYENDINRARRLIQNAHAGFKNDLPPHTLNAYLADYARLEKILGKIEKSMSYKVYETLYKYLLQFVYPESVAAMVLTGRFTNDYEKLQNQVEDIINNKLYYTSAKFKQLSNRK